ncbi:MAG: hypothetical protein ACREUT_01935 [Steroidobacteraceae bacterium]
MNDIDLLTAKAQVSLTRLTLIGFLMMLAVLLLLLAIPEVKASSEIISLVSAATGSLGTILTQQNGYFFARHRPSASTQPPAEHTPIPPMQPAQPANPNP